MSGAIHDDAARSFAIGFYGALGEQESVAAAYQHGRAAVCLDGLPDADQPQLLVREGFEVTQLILAVVAPVLRQELPCPYPGLTGAQLVVKEPSGALISITIASVDMVHYWAALPGVPPSMTPPIETYDLRWAPFHVAEGDPVCGNPRRATTRSTRWDVARTAVVFEGDRIDANLKTVAPMIESAWFNIGCAGHAIAKLALTGHTEAARADGYQTDPEERQAMLKMLTGDYCGTGNAFTASGERLYWRDDRGWMSFLGGVHPVVEARWTSVGAACLGAPRLDVNAPLSGWPATLGMPAIKQILAACSTLPPCADLDPTHQGGAHLVTANPL
jgi:hypothetical protein